MLCDGIESAERRLLEGLPALLAADACDSPEALDRVLAAQRACGGSLAIVNLERFLPSRQAIKAQLDADKLGEVGLARIHRWEPAGVRERLPWPLDVDLALWLIGRRVEVVFATGVAERGYLQIHLGFEGGAMALVDYAPLLLPGDGYASLSVVGSKGAAYADDQSNQQLLLAGGSARAILAGEGERHLDAAARAFESGQIDAAASVADWREVLVFAAAVRQSLDTRQAVRLRGTPA